MWQRRAAKVQTWAAGAVDGSMTKTPQLLLGRFSFRSYDDADTACRQFA